MHFNFQTGEFEDFDIDKLINILEVMDVQYGEYRPLFEQPFKTIAFSFKNMKAEQIRTEDKWKFWTQPDLKTVWVSFSDEEWKEFLALIEITNEWPLVMERERQQILTTTDTRLFDAFLYSAKQNGTKSHHFLLIPSQDFQNHAKLVVTPNSMRFLAYIEEMIDPRQPVRIGKISSTRWQFVQKYIEILDNPS